MKSALLDSDVILDFFFDRQPHAQYAAFILTQCELGRLQGYVTAVILSNVYYLLRKTSSHQRVVKKLNQLLTLIDVQVIDKPTAIKALNSRFKDFEDALQNYASEQSGQIDLIITRNTRDYRASSLSVLTPEEFVNFEANIGR
ncbi:MAG: PIN domain-containing protein [Saprospiraceae bacterium]|nr:PIN domain-containing protein [Saprospiraceae bacterium]